MNLFTEMEQIQNVTTENTVLMSDFKWCDSATSLMLKHYREKQVKFNNPHVKKKVVWREIAEIMQQNGFAFDADRCERKFLNLKTSYRNTIQHNCMTGNLSRTCAFFAELHEIFQMQIGLEESKSPAMLQPSPVRLVANSNNVQVVSVSVSEGKESRPTITSPPADQSTFRYSSQRQQTVQISQQSQSISESPFEKRPTPHSIPNSSPSSFHATASMFLEASAQRNSSSNRHTHGEFQAQQQKPPDNHNDRRQSTHQPVSNTTQRALSANSIPTSASTQVLHHQENGRNYQNTSIIDLCNNGRKRVQSTDDDARQERVKKRKNNELQSLLTSFEKYREEQKGREDDRMKMMKEFHNEEMKVMNRFLDIIQQCIQYSSDD